MGMKKWKSGISLFMAAALTITSLGMTNPLAANAAAGGAKAPSAGVRAITGDNPVVTGDNATYYIDAANGSDSNDGKSEANAWKSFAKVSGLRLGPGGKVLLKAGCTWNGEKLMIKDAAGSAENPVILGSYGTGAAPVINGQGSKWLDSMDRASLKKEDVAAVHIQNSEYITIQNLEVTNWEEDKADLEGRKGRTNTNANSPGRKILYDQSKYMLTGLLVENHDAGELKGVKIENNYIHDVNGYMSQNGSEGHKKGSGGLMVLVTGGNTESYFSDLEITGNEVENVCHEAIYMESCWAARKLVGGAGSQQAGSKPWVGWPNVEVGDNYVHDVAGDGIVLINADGGTAYNNLLVRCASENWYYGRNPAHAAIWAWDCNNAVFENNEAAWTESTQDGMAFDSDYGNQNILFQYNYSHDNKGGFWMACPGPYYSINSVVRYNVSVNDCKFNGGRILKVGESGSIGHQVYNNTIYWNDEFKDVQAVEQGSWISGSATPYTSGTDIYNNIFYGDSAAFVNHEGVRYHSNCVWGGAQKAYPWEEDLTGMAADPGLKGVSEEGIDETMISEGEFAENMVETGSVEALELTKDSPCIDAGENHMAVPNESFEAVADEKLADDKTWITLENVDYNGDAVPYKAGAAATAAEKVDIGAIEYAGAYQGSYTASEDEKAWLQELVNQAKGLDKTKFEEASVTRLNTMTASAEAALKDRPVQVSAMVSRMEYALMNMDRKGSGTGEPENLLADKDPGFENGKGNWGNWASGGTVSVSASNEQAHSGSQSLKIEYANAASDTAYSELGSIAVEQNTDYILEAWMYCANEADVPKVGVEAKHHNSVTGGKGDIKLAQPSLTADEPDPAKPGWYKMRMEFTTQGYSTISVAFSSNNTVVYVDDVTLYPAQTTSVKLNRKNIEAALAKTPEYGESAYPVYLWKAYQEAYDAARIMRINAAAEQADLDNAADALNKAFGALARKAEKTGLLEAYYTTHAAKEKGNYTDVSWNRFQTALQNAKTVLDKGTEATQREADNALADLKAAVSKLAENPVIDPVKKDQTITVKGSFTKKASDKAFNLNAKTDGDGTLKYTSSDKKVATVNAAGKVTLKGAGVCTITVNAGETDNYNKAAKKVTITVKPKKMAVSSAKPAKGRKLTVKWKKDTTVTGYEIQCCQKKNFKSGVKKASVKKAKTTSTTFKKLKKGKKYYVRIRAYKTVKVNGKDKKLTGDWSKVKTSGKIK